MVILKQPKKSRNKIIIKGPKKQVQRPKEVSNLDDDQQEIIVNQQPNGNENKIIIKSPGEEMMKDDVNGDVSDKFKSRLLPIPMPILIPVPEKAYQKMVS